MAVMAKNSRTGPPPATTPLKKLTKCVRLSVGTSALLACIQNSYVNWTGKYPQSVEAKKLLHTDLMRTKTEAASSKAAMKMYL